MSIPRDDSQFGTVLYLAGNPAGKTYLDRYALLPWAAERLTASYSSMPVIDERQKRSAQPLISGARALSLFCWLKFDGPDTITLKLEQWDDDPYDPDLPGWYLTQLQSQTSPGTVSSEMAITAGGAGEVRVLLQTASQYLGDIARVSAKCSSEGSTHEVKVGLKAFW